MSKASSIKHILFTYDPDIVVATETWLSPEISSSEIFPKEFNMTCYRNDRKSRGGGVLIAAKPGLVITPLPDIQSDCEIVWVKVQIKNCKTLYLAAFYRPPDSDIDYLAGLNTSLQKVDHTKNIWVTGDFNLPDINWAVTSACDPFIEDGSSASLMKP